MHEPGNCENCGEMLTRMDEQRGHVVCGDCRLERAIEESPNSGELGLKKIGKVMGRYRHLPRGGLTPRCLYIWGGAITHYDMGDRNSSQLMAYLPVITPIP